MPGETLGVAAIIEPNPEHMELMTNILLHENIGYRGFRNPDAFIDADVNYGSLIIDPATLRPDELGRLQNHLARMNTLPDLYVNSADWTNTKIGYLKQLYGQHYTVIEKPYNLEVVQAKLQVLKAGLIEVASQVIAA